MADIDTKNSGQVRAVPDGGQTNTVTLKYFYGNITKFVENKIPSYGVAVSESPTIQTTNDILEHVLSYSPTIVDPSVKIEDDLRVSITVASLLWLILLINQAQYNHI